MGKVKSTKTRRSSVVKSLQTRYEIARLSAQNVYQHEIAKRLGIAGNSVEYHLKKVKEEWKEKYTATFEQRQQEELARLDWIIREAAEAWEKSKQPVVRTSTEQTHRRARVNLSEPLGEFETQPLGADGFPLELSSMVLDNQKATTTIEQSCGDPVFLKIIESAIERKCHIQGLNEPQKVLLGFELVNPANVDPNELASAINTIDSLITRAKAPLALTGVRTSGEADRLEPSVSPEIL